MTKHNKYSYKIENEELKWTIFIGFIALVAFGVLVYLLSRRPINLPGGKTLVFDQSIDTFILNARKEPTSILGDELKASILARNCLDAKANYCKILQTESDGDVIPNLGFSLKDHKLNRARNRLGKFCNFYPDEIKDFDYDCGEEDWKKSRYYMGARYLTGDQKEYKKNL